ncbi:flagellar hook-associated protein FlgK [Nocardioides mangrovi]|uniref:Flagellar hook-associated protein 1 n=1 Tax=Nocardioides mangrovi TaxID=2874580 RepID=A0ABS7U9Y9_9ACTN|nr:flagellar hook-associated protein FlgK [Nocardioides mangrovi]MBZ5737800.1 flagellar hook-associated protein FlgK [Nocardioides mangrovi]
MTGFSSINTALTALRYQQGVIDVASTNVANASTEGYVRRRLIGQTIETANTSALWSRSSSLGSGVTSSGVQRINDPLLDARMRREHGTQGYLDLKSAAMSRLETGIAEPSSSGLAAALNNFKSALQDLVNSPGSDAARSQVLSTASIAADAFNLQSSNFAAEAQDQRARVSANVLEINDVANQLASTNKTLAAATANGSDTSTLMDTRDALALRLSELSGATAKIRDDGGMDITVNGVSLVSGGKASKIEIASGIEADGTASDPAAEITFSVVAPDGTSTDVDGALGGEIGAGVELIDKVIPDYVSGLNQIAADFADAINAVQTTGYDIDGNIGSDFFSYDPDDAAASLKVVLTKTSEIAASSESGGVLDAANADAMSDAITVGDAYQRLVNNFGSSVNTVKQLAENQQVMTTQVDNAREQLTGVSQDEETVNMVMAQKSYQAAARVMTTVDEMLDTLINRTGKVGL